MADTKITNLTALGTTPNGGDLIPIVDVTDTTMGASGTDKKATWTNIVSWINSALNTVFMALVAPGTTGNVLTSNGSSWTSAAPTTPIPYVAPGTSGNVLTSNGSSWTSATPSGGSGGNPANQLLNGGFNFYQRLPAPGTLTTVATDAYGPDRWRCSSQSASFQVQQLSAAAETGLTSLHMGAFKQITNSGKFMICQILEGINSISLRGKTVIFQCQMKASSSKTMKMAVIQLNSSGTLDTIPATFVSAWGSNTVDPTLGTNLAVVTGSQSCSVTTSMAVYNVSVTIPSNSNNIVVAIWSDSQFAANDILTVAEAGLYVASTTQAWNSQSIDAEWLYCLRYFEALGGINTFIFAMSQAYSTTHAQGVLLFHPKRRITTSSDFTNPGTIGHLLVADGGGSGHAATAFTYPYVATDRAGFDIQVASGLTAEQAGFVFSAVSTDYIYISTEL